MTDSPRPGSPYDDRTGRFPESYPAYSGYTPPAYQNPHPTEQLPSDWAYATQHPLQPPPPPPQSPKPPRSPKWLWVAAAVAVLLVVGMVGALIITNGDSSTDTEASSATLTEPTFTVPSRSSTTPRTTTSRAPAPSTTTPLLPTTTTAPTGATETVVYQIDGEGRALTITYVDNGNLMQTEYNVTLPWSKQVTLESPANEAASVVVVNVGREINCSVTVDGVVVSTRTGSGLTVCSRAVG